MQPSHPRGRFSSSFWTAPRTYIQQYRSPHLTPDASSFLHYTPPTHTTWADVLEVAKRAGAAKTEWVRGTAKFLHPETDEIVTEVEGVPIQGVVRASKLGLDNHAAYWQAQFHLYRAYRRAGGHTKQEDIRTDRMPGAGDPVF